MTQPSAETLRAAFARQVREQEQELRSQLVRAGRLPINPPSKWSPKKPRASSSDYCLAAPPVGQAAVQGKLASMKKLVDAEAAAAAKK